MLLLDFCRRTLYNWDMKDTDEEILGGTAKQEKTTADLTTGNLLTNIIKFTIPIILTGILQLLFNAADIAVVGNFANNTALAAVGATSALNNLVVNLILGLSVGAGVCVARCFGAKDDKGVFEVVHTAMLTAVIGGIVFGAIGVCCCKTFLQWMSTPDNVIDQSTTYIRIIFCGVPFMVVYNFGASILRSVGNTKQPLYYLVTAGVINVFLNLFFVLVLKRDVDGVAYATIISQFVSCVLVVRYLIKVNGPHKLYVKKLKIYGRRLRDIAVIGLPAGLQGSVFSISNVLIQSSINGFGDVVMSANTAAGNIEGFVYTSMNAFHQTALTFVGQHIGAKKERRIKNIFWICIACVSVVGLTLGLGAYLLGSPLLSLYAKEEIRNDVIKYGLIRLSWVSAPYLLCGVMDTLSGLLRGIGKSVEAMVLTLFFACGFRIFWIYTVFAKYHTLSVLYASYPISWALCIVFEALLFWVSYKKMLKKADLNRPTEILQPAPDQT